MMIIHRDDDGYHVEHLGPIGAQVRALFGTTILPAPFTRQARPRAVQEAIQRINPGVVVCLNPDLLDEESRDHLPPNASKGETEC